MDEHSLLLLVRARVAFCAAFGCRLRAFRRSWLLFRGGRLFSRRGFRGGRLFSRRCFSGRCFSGRLFSRRGFRGRSFSGRSFHCRRIRYGCFRGGSFFRLRIGFNNRRCFFLSRLLFNNSRCRLRRRRFFRHGLFGGLRGRSGSRILWLLRSRRFRRGGRILRHGWLCILFCCRLFRSGCCRGLFRWHFAFSGRRGRCWLHRRRGKLFNHSGL